MVLPSFALKQLKKENRKLKRRVANLSLDKSIFQEALRVLKPA